MVYYAKGDYDKALEMYEEARAVQEVHDSSLKAVTYLIIVIAWLMFIASLSMAHSIRLLLRNAALGMASFPLPFLES